MTIGHSSAFMLHRLLATLKPNKDNPLNDSDPVMETPSATLSYVFGTKAWAVSFTSSFLPFQVCSTRCQAKTERDFVSVRYPYGAVVFDDLYNPYNKQKRKPGSQRYQASYASCHQVAQQKQI